MKGNGYQKMISKHYMMKTYFDKLSIGKNND